MFSVDEDVLASDETMIREGLRLAEDFAVNELEIEPLYGVSVEIRARNIDQNFVAYATNHRITIQTGHPLWIDTYAPLRRQQNPIHEYFHLVQEKLTETSLTLQNAGPVWMVEGSAEYFGWQALSDADVVDADDVRTYHLANVVLSEQMGSLEHYETGNELFSFGSSYSLSALAIEMLVEDVGITSLADFYASLNDVSSWQEAFTDSFGQSPVTFYAAFEERRLGFGMVDPTDPFLGALQQPAWPVDDVFDVAIISQDTTVTQGDQAVLHAATVPGAGCTLKFFSAAGDSLLSYPARADTRGVVFWLWTVDEETDPGTTPIEVECGGTPLSTSIDVS